MISDWSVDEAMVNRMAWADALVSGDYRQGFNRLVQFDGRHVRYCCLGVASDLAAEAGVIPKRRDETWRFAGEWALLPNEVQGWLGLAGSNAPLMKQVRIGSAGNRVFCPDLTAVNDAGALFWKIAAMIRNGDLKLARDAPSQGALDDALRVQ